MAEIKTLLITGGGAPGIAGTIYAIRNNDDQKPFRIITTDIKADPVGGYMADKCFKVPPPEDADYLPAIKEITVKERVHVILPQTTREVITLARNQDQFHHEDIRVVVAGAEAVARANDKYLLLKECEKIGVPVPEYRLVRRVPDLAKALDQLGYPQSKVVVKPCQSNGMRGLRILAEDNLLLGDFLNKKPDGTVINQSTLMGILNQGEFPPMLVSEYLPGEEYTVDMFRNSRGMVCIPRLRQAIRSGISFHTRVRLRPDLMEHCRRLAHLLDLKYCFGFQFKLDAHGVPKILEANPRVQGTMVVSIFAGFNVIYAAVKQAMGEEVSLNNVTLRENVGFIRYWGGIGVEGGRIVGQV